MQKKVRKLRLDSVESNRYEPFMKYFRLFSTGLLMFGCLFSQLVAQGDAKTYAKSIKIEDLNRHLLVLTSDSLQGRETGTLGQKRAADYLAAQFATIGLSPVTTATGEVSYFQSFSVRKVTWNKIVLTVLGKKYVHLEKMLYLGNSPQSKDQILEVLLPGESPNSASERHLLVYVAQSVSKWREKAAMARKADAMGALVFVEDKAFDQEILAYRPYLKSRYMLADEESGLEAFSLVLPARSFASFFGVALSDSSAIKRKTVQISLKADLTKETVQTENVVGYLEGGAQSKELVALTAHYDHLGMRGNSIYRGADDNGTGTSALIEVAEAFALAKLAGTPLARSLLFIAMTGEEKGLLGSDYYTQHPLFPLAETVANLNVDMIGRVDEAHKNDPNYVYLIGSDRLSSELHALSEDANSRHTQLTLDYTFNAEDDPNRFYYRSDHYNFAKQATKHE